MLVYLTAIDKSRIRRRPHHNFDRQATPPPAGRTRHLMIHRDVLVLIVYKSLSKDQDQIKWLLAEQIDEKGFGSFGCDCDISKPMMLIDNWIYASGP